MIIILCICRQEARIEELISVDTLEVDTQIEILVLQVDRVTVGEIGRRIADHRTVGFGDLAVARDIAEFQVARSHGRQRVFRRRGDVGLVLVDALDLVAVEITDGLARFRYGHALVALIVGLAQREHLVVDRGQVTRNGIAEIVADRVAPRSRQLEAAVADRTRIDQTVLRAHERFEVADQVFGLLAVIGRLDVQALVEHLHLEAHFPCLGLLPAQIRRQIGLRIGGDDVVAEDGVRGVERRERGIIAALGTDVLVTQHAVRPLDLQVVDHMLVAHEILFGHDPSGTDRVEVVPRVARVLEHRRTVAAEREVDQVAAVVVVERTEQVRHRELAVLRAAVGRRRRVADRRDPPLVGIVRNRQVGRSDVLAAAAGELLVVGEVGRQTGHQRQVVLVGEGLRIGEDVVLLRIERVGLRLRQRLAVAAGVDRPQIGIVFVFHRREEPRIVRQVVDREGGAEFQFGQEIDLAVDIAREAVVLRLVVGGELLDVDHRVGDLRTLERRQFVVAARRIVVDRRDRSRMDGAGHVLRIGR